MSVKSTSNSSINQLSIPLSANLSAIFIFMLPRCFGIIPTRYHLPWDGRQQAFCLPIKGIPLLMFFPFCNENYFLSWLLSLGPCQFSPRQRGLSICRSFQGRLNRPKGGVPKLLPTSEWELFCQPRQRSVTVLRASPPSLWLSLTLPSSVQHSEQVLEAHSFKFIFLLCQIKSISDL